MDHACVTCGKPVELATAEYTEAGLRCARCSLEQSVRDQEQRVVERDAEVREIQLRRRVRLLARLHAVGWVAFGMCGVLFVPVAMAIALLAAVVPVTICVLMRRRWAYWAVMALDGAAALAFLGGGLYRFPWSEWWIPVVASLFPQHMMLMLRLARRAYLSEPR
jgi:DNA-directed RNA polymerase subunit RPC12/RpoP